MFRLIRRLKSAIGKMILQIANRLVQIGDQVFLSATDLARTKSPVEQPSAAK